MRAAAACRDFRLGVVGDAEARRLDHGDVVGAVAGDERLVRREAESRAQFDQRRELRLAPEDRLGHLAGQLAVGVDQQRIGAVLVEADHRGDALGEQREAAGDEAGIGAVLAHGGDQRARRPASARCARR